MTAALLRMETELHGDLHEFRQEIHYGLSEYQIGYAVGSIVNHCRFILPYLERNEVSIVFENVGHVEKELAKVVIMAMSVIPQHIKPDYSGDKLTMKYSYQLLTSPPKPRIVVTLLPTDDPRYVYW